MPNRTCVASPGVCCGTGAGALAGDVSGASGAAGRGVGIVSPATGKRSIR